MRQDDLCFRLRRRDTRKCRYLRDFSRDAARAMCRDRVVHRFIEFSAAGRAGRAFICRAASAAATRPPLDAADTSVIIFIFFGQT